MMHSTDNTIAVVSQEVEQAKIIRHDVLENLFCIDKYAVYNLVFEKSDHCVYQSRISLHFHEEEDDIVVYRQSRYTDATGIIQKEYYNYTHKTSDNDYICQPSLVMEKKKCCLVPLFHFFCTPIYDISERDVIPCLKFWEGPQSHPGIFCTYCNVDGNSYAVMYPYEGYIYRLVLEQTT